MKDLKERLVAVKDSQQALVKEYQAIIAEYESHDLIREAELLRSQYEECKRRLQDTRQQLDRLEEENGRLRVAMTEQMMDEKLNLIKVSREKLETYFAVRLGEQKNRLSALEEEALRRCRLLEERASLELAEERRAFTDRIDSIAAELNEAIVRRRERLLEEERLLHLDALGGLLSMAEEELDEETVQKRIKQNQLELKIGLNALNKLAILLLIFGVGAAFKYTYSNWFSGYMKGGAFFLLGLMMLGAGEWLHRRKRETFSLGLLGGGISVLYGSIFYSYFLLDIIGMFTGLALSVLVTVAAVLLALRYESRTICALGLVGGYLPLFSYTAAFGLEGAAVYAAMAYLFLLNLSLLLVSFRKRWLLVHYISFALNTPSMIALVWLSDSRAVGALYALLTFLMYLGITLWYPLAYKIKLYWRDVILLALNTAVSCSTLYALLGRAGLKDYRGLLALLFCLVYLALGRLAAKHLKQEKETIILFYATSLTFAVLAIPFQFGVKWVSMGWLIEGIILTVWANWRQAKRLERGGWLIFLLCLFSFFWVDVLPRLFGVDLTGEFTLKYTCITLGMLMLTVYYAGRYHGEEKRGYGSPAQEQFARFIKYGALANVWIYLIHEIHDRYRAWVPGDMAHYDFYLLLLLAFATFALAFILMRAKLLYDRIVRNYSLFLYAAGCWMSFRVTLGIPAVEDGSVPGTAAEYIALLVLAAFHVLIFFTARQFVVSFIRKTRRSAEQYPLIMGLYLIATVTAYLNVQFRLGDMGFIFSLLYLALSIAYIVYGLRAKYVYIRRLGLGLTLFATGKLFVYDLSFLTAGSKIIAYFCFGLVLLGISYLYQKIASKTEERHGGASADVPAEGGTGAEE